MVLKLGPNFDALLFGLQLTSLICRYCRDIEMLLRPLLSQSLSHKPFFGCDMSLDSLMSRRLDDVTTSFLAADVATVLGRWT